LALLELTLRATLDFLLFDWLAAGDLAARPRHAEHTRATFDAVLDTSERMAAELFAPVNRLVDTQEPTFDGKRVSLPEATRRAVGAYGASGLLAAGHDYDDGGMQLPYVIDMAANSFFSMASIALSAYAMLTYANINLLMAHGSATQRRAFALPQMNGRNLGTMCLSEPQAGSSLGDILTRAIPDGGGFEADPLGPRYRLKGNKMWISGGEHELGENIIHLVLAKIPDDQGRLPAGPKGISLFIVPRWLVDLDGKTSQVRNDVALAGLNHKLGYRGIPNTLLNFGEGRHLVDGAAGAVGYRIGAPGDGLQCMFHMMNEARINVGMGATMLAWAGYEASLVYARERTQGRLPASGGKSADAPPVPIIRHADVKRMLLAQKAICEGGLALGLYCARLVDEKATATSSAVQEAGLLLELLTPVAKSWPSEWGLEANNLAIQIHGGYGYTRDFPVEQFWRDNRLNMIHEGTHAIHGIDLLGRKVLARGGAAMLAWSGRVEDTIARAGRHAVLVDHAEALQAKLAQLRAATQAATEGTSAVQALANATPYLRAFGHVTVAWLLLDVATLACERLQQELARPEGFFEGLLQSTHYFFRFELPQVQPWLATVAKQDSTCVEMQENWF